MIINNITVPNPDISIEECDASLGRYLRNWGYVESAMEFLFCKLLNTDLPTGTIITRGGVDGKVLRDIIEGLARHRLNKRDAITVEQLMQRVQKTASKRNKLVHARWTIVLDFAGPPREDLHGATGARWFRYYAPSDSALAEKIFSSRDQKLTSQHRFTVFDIDRAGRDCQKLSTDISNFSDSFTLTPAPAQLLGVSP